MWIKIFMCSYSGYWIVDLHLRDKDLFDINFVSYMYLFIYLSVCLFVCICSIYLFD